MARRASESGVALRRTMITAWIAMLVPIGGVALAVVVGRSDAEISSTDPVVTLAFSGGAAIGLALWVVGMMSLLRRPAPGRPVGTPSLWVLLAAWPMAVGVFVVVNLVAGNGGAAAGVATAVALGWWWRCWATLSPPVPTPAQQGG